LYFGVEKTKIEIHEEYILFDVGDIFTSFGGSLGLFLGFSFLEVLIMSARFVYNKLEPIL